VATKRPLINSEPVSEFGAAMAEDLTAKVGQAVDYTYVPGWSELRIRRDTEMAEYAQGTRRGQDVSTLPGHLMWTSVTKGAGDTPGSPKTLMALNEGYEAVLGDQVGKVPWLTAMPPGARQLPTGEIVNAAGDAMLMFAPAPVAARNQARKARATTEQLDAVGGARNLGDGTEGLAGAGDAYGIETSVERTKGK
jgi:hypothetical protein